MKLVKYRDIHGEAAAGVLEGDQLIPIDMSGRQFNSLADILEEDDPMSAVEFLMDRSRTTTVDQVELVAPIDQQEVWAAGVTYKRSQTARMEESEAAASCYDRVYASPRPELFLKATPHRVSGPDKPLRIRSDSEWNVPEPELTLVINSRMQLVGFTVGNDMSSRDIEGENPLYLPQAKVYNECCGLGPAIMLPTEMPSPENTGISLKIVRGGEKVFDASTNAGQMARSYQELIDWLGRDNSFPNGVFLMTGTGIVPDEFTLLPGDVVSITIDGIGTLTNPIVQG
ncbi:MAG: 2-dehydro-3-deoxy-D-arabinonate dehydratase [Pirellulaceae bacterium]|jgi:2-dehydro-3-deoxy-D-arabinonate dehydratase